MGSLPLVNENQSVPVPANSQHQFAGELTIENRSRHLINVIFDSEDRRIDFEYYNDQGRKVSNNAMFGPRVIRIKFEDSDLNGVELRFYH